MSEKQLLEDTLELVEEMSDRLDQLATDVSEMRNALFSALDKPEEPA